MQQNISHIGVCEVDVNDVWSGDLFSEVQWFRTNPLVVVVWAAALLIWYGFYIQIVAGVPFGTNPAPDWVMWVLLVAFGMCLPALFLLLRLEVRVGGGSLSYRLYPVHLHVRDVPCRNIATAEAVTCRPVREYGGWGIRHGKGGPAYTVSGNRGVRISLEGDSSLFIGSQRADECAAALHSCMREG